MLENFNLNRMAVMVIPLILAVSVHEAAHGWAALKLGDDTAARAGRVTLNPIRHLDLFGSFILPLLLAVSGAPFVLGYAKPVPVNFARLSNRIKGTIGVALAGITANLIFLAISGLLFRLLYALTGQMVAGPVMTFIIVDLFLILYFSVAINAILAVFNLLPLPPLDGSRVISVFLPPSIQKRLASIERFGILVMILVLMFKPEIIFGLLEFFMTPLISLALGEAGVVFMRG